MSQSYGGYIWSDEPADPYNSNTNSAVSLGIAAGLGYGVFRMGTMEHGGTRPIDHVASYARTGGNLSPFQLGNTFRVPEVLSPFTSTGYKQASGVDTTKLGHGFTDGIYRWDKSFLESDSTYDWLKTVTGVNDDALRQAGIRRGMMGPDTELATGLIWEKRAGSSHAGTLSALRGGKKVKLSGDIALMAMNEEVTNLLTGKTGLNRIAAGMFGAADMYSGETFKEDDVFSRMADVDGTVTRQRAGFMPIPSVSGSTSRVGDVGRRTMFARGIASFEMGRFNRLLEGLGEQFGGEAGTRFMRDVVGTTPGVRPGPASAMMLRFGGKAAMLGGAMLSVGELDHLRRQVGLPGQVMASGVMSAGATYAAHRMKATPGQTMMVGVASFFGQLALPGFDQGVVQGFASTATVADIWLRGSPVNPFHHLRRTIDGFAPGFTGWETGALASIAVMGAASFRVPGVGRVPNALMAQFGPDALGLRNVTQDQVRASTSTIGDVFWRGMSGYEGGGLNPHSYKGQAQILESLRRTRFGGSGHGLSKFMNAQWASAEQSIKKTAENNAINKSMLSHLEAINTRFGGEGAGNYLQKQMRGWATQGLYSFFGADATGDKATAEAIKNMGFHGPTGRMGRLATLGTFTFAAHQLFTGGALGSMEGGQELSDIYSGKQLVEVKKGRWWEGGGTPFEGGRTSYFRPHAYHLMMTRSREAGIWGADEDSRSPLSKFYTKNFTYDLEKEQYYDRPYPISGAAFADVPIIGGLLGSTIGRLIKPPRLMHVGEWARPGEGGQMEFASVFKGSRREPAFSLGAKGPGIPQSPFGSTETMAHLSYQFRELEGITGWAKNVLQAKITGSETWNTDDPVLAQAGAMSSWRNQFWEAQLGGMLFTNEALRRILPRIPYEKRGVNPIMNSMPSWLPDKFHYGDPYRAVEWGEARLPGSGYAALHPELSGIDPEDYPLLYQYAILGDVAPYSMEYRSQKERVYQRRSAGKYTSAQMDFMDAADARHARVMNQYSFEQMDPNAVRLPGSGAVAGAYMGAQSMIRGAVAPAEYLVPMGFRPFQKLMGNRDPIEQYEYERLYGTPMAFWDKPWRDWLRPSIYSAASMMGYEGKPWHRQEADATNEYFDKLQYIKQMQIAGQAEAAGDTAAARSARWAASQTRTGVNPQGNPLGIYWSLPAEERKFFNAFSHAQGSDRARIRQMIPSDSVHLYEAMWSRMDSGDSGLWAGSPSAVDDQYLAGQTSHAQEYMGGRAAPAADWIGWNQDVDMDDIKVRYINELGRDIHDFGLWESTLKQSMGQGFLEGSTDFLHQQGGPANSTSRMRAEMYNLLGPSGTSPYLEVNNYNGMGSSASFTYNDDRHDEAFARVSRLINGY